MSDHDYVSAFVQVLTQMCQEWSEKEKPEKLSLAMRRWIQYFVRR